MTTAAELIAADNFAAARRAMIDSQLRTSGVTDPAVIAAMITTPRETGLPAAARNNAYIDRAIALTDGSWLPAPLFHGQLLAEASLQPTDRVLVIGCGSGYLVALVQKLAAAVDACSPAKLADFAAAPVGYDVILIEGAAEVLPDRVTALLAEGGRIVTGVAGHGVTRLAVGRKLAGRISLLPVADMGIPQIAEFAQPNQWSF